MNDIKIIKRGRNKNFTTIKRHLVKKMCFIVVKFHFKNDLIKHIIMHRGNGMIFLLKLII
jgi:hypothetical protein